MSQIYANYYRVFNIMRELQIQRLLPDLPIAELFFNEDNNLKCPRPSPWNPFNKIQSDSIRHLSCRRKVLQTRQLCRTNIYSNFNLISFVNGNHNMPPPCKGKLLTFLASNIAQFSLRMAWGYHKKATEICVMFGCAKVHCGSVIRSINYNWIINSEMNELCDTGG